MCAPQAAGLRDMYRRANATLEAIQRTAGALADVEAAAAAVERAKGHNDELVDPPSSHLECLVESCMADVFSSFNVDGTCPLLLQ